MIRTKNGEIWMSLSFHNEILRYDGTRWYRITIKEKDPLQVVQQMRLFPGDEIIAIESGKGHYMKYNGDDFIPIPGLPATRIINFQKDIDGEYVFSTEEGIFKKIRLEYPASFKVDRDKKFCQNGPGYTLHCRGSDHFLFKAKERYHQA